MPLSLRHVLPLCLTIRMHYNWIYFINEFDADMLLVVKLYLEVALTLEVALFCFIIV